MSFAGYSFMPIEHVEVSKLERWIITENGSHSHQWKCTEHTDTSLRGRTFTCYKVPPIYFAPIRTLDGFVDSADPVKIREFVQIMCNGTEKQQREAIDNLVESR
jgi:hypothetical protein